MEPKESWSVFQKKMLRVEVLPDRSVYAAKGSMVAYQGMVDFSHHSGGGGIGSFMKRAISSDNTPLMEVSGQADVFFASTAYDVHIIHLEGDSVCVNGQNLLAFEGSLNYDLRMNKGAGFVSGGVWSTFLEGTGRVAVTSDGAPVLLDTSTVPTFTDTNATVAWAGHMSPALRSSMNMKSMLRGGTGEAFQYAFQGPGWVLVQPSEGPPVATTNSGNSGIMGLNILGS